LCFTKLTLAGQTPAWRDRSEFNKRRAKPSEAAALEVTKSITVDDQYRQGFFRADREWMFVRSVNTWFTFAEISSGRHA
jgi:hypothetical protein